MTDQENSNFVPVDDLMRYESGHMRGDETLVMFQKLVNSGMAWELQGSYGRMAASLIRNGLITAPRKDEK